MSNYSDKADSVRVDFFKESGKWGYTEAVIWTGAYLSLYDPKNVCEPGAKPRPDGAMIHDAFAKSLVDHLRDGKGNVRHSGMTAVCLEPYHEHSHPIMMTVDHAVALVDDTAPKYRPLAPPGDA